MFSFSYYFFLLSGLSYLVMPNIINVEYVFLCSVQFNRTFYDAVTWKDGICACRRFVCLFVPD